MSLKIEIQRKENTIIYKSINNPNSVVKIKEVQEIRDAVQEHLLFLGLDRANNIRSISLIGVGTGNEITVDSKYIVRTDLVTASDRVILVHNHPSNKLEPSNQDRYISNVTSKLLKAFNIELLDHIIVTENSYISMGEMNAIDRDYENNRTNIVDRVLLLEENNKLQKEVEYLTNKLRKYKEKIEEEEFE